jgi:hypothetical protein
MSGIPRPSNEMGTIEDKHFTKKGWEINIISGGFVYIGPLVHICGNADTLLLPDNLSKALKDLGLPSDFVQQKMKQADNYIAEGASLTTNGYNERASLLEMLRDALKLNVTIAQKGRGSAEQDTSEPKER